MKLFWLNVKSEFEAIGIQDKKKIMCQVILLSKKRKNRPIGH